MDLKKKIKDFDLEQFFCVEGELDEEKLEEVLNEVQTYVQKNLLYGTFYDGLLYKMFVSISIKYLMYANTDMPFTLRSLYDISNMLDKTSIYEWSEFDYMIYQMDCDDGRQRANILHEHCIFNMFFERCYHEEEFSFCLLETLLHTMCKFLCKYELYEDFEEKHSLYEDINRLYNTALLEDKPAFFIQCKQFLNRDKNRNL